MQWKKKTNICFGWKFKGCAGIRELCLDVVGIACRGIIWSDCFSWRHTQLVCPLNVSIFIISTLKSELNETNVTFNCMVYCNAVTRSHSAFSKRRSSKESQIVDDRWLYNMRNVPLLLWGNWLLALGIPHITQLKNKTWNLPLPLIFSTDSQGQCDLFYVGVNVDPWRRQGQKQCTSSCRRWLQPARARFIYLLLSGHSCVSVTASPIWSMDTLLFFSSNVQSPATQTEKKKLLHHKHSGLESCIIKWIPG